MTGGIPHGEGWGRLTEQSDTAVVENAFTLLKLQYRTKHKHPELSTSRVSAEYEQGENHGREEGPAGSPGSGTQAIAQDRCIRGALRPDAGIAPHGKRGVVLHRVQPDEEGTAERSPDSGRLSAHAESG
jgi:RES domain-containing protein